ncbi:hypothetical protein HY988_05190 [Candidatus Micrarchaeota archaeon]|nr:hypothetical protein [Candidatus Micrarchaeota archaeon]
MNKMLIALLLFATLSSAEFLLESVDVKISDIKDDGSAKVHESIKVIMFGNYSKSLYDSGIQNNELAFWSNIDLKDVKFHVNSAIVDIRDFRLRPQPRTKCNPIEGICHGELIMDYYAYPSYLQNPNTEPVPGTGIFQVSQYKPRTKRYTLNPKALSFTTTPEGNIILDKNVFLNIQLPKDSVTLDVNPQPTDKNLQLPQHIDSLSWSDIVLVKFSLIFDVEESVDREVTGFFSGMLNSAVMALSSPQGLSLLILVIVLIGSYTYVVVSKRRRDE